MYRVVIHGIYQREDAESLAKQLQIGMPSSMHVSVEEDDEKHDIEAENEEE